MRIISSISVVFLMTMLVSSCSDDDTPAVINEEEVITTVQLTVTEVGTDAPEVVYEWKDGSGDAITLQNNSSYNVKIDFLDESDPLDIEDITEEVIEEKDDHFVFYETTVSDLEFTSNATDDVIDSDDIGINISTDWSVGDATSGTITATLIHEPTTKVGDARSDFGGETDIEVSFDVTVE